MALAIIRYKSNRQIDDMLVLVAFDEVVNEVSIEYGLEDTCDE